MTWIRRRWQISLSNNKSIVPGCVTRVDATMRYSLSDTPRSLASKLRMGQSVAACNTGDMHAGCRVVKNKNPNSSRLSDARGTSPAACCFPSAWVRRPISRPDAGKRIIRVFHARWKVQCTHRGEPHTPTTAITGIHTTLLYTRPRSLHVMSHSTLLASPSIKAISLLCVVSCSRMLWMKYK